MYKYHPDVTGLKCNEYGSEILLNGERLKINRLKGNWKYVLINNRMVGITRIVCECWNGMASNPKWIVHRRDGNLENNHYSNLYWRTKGNQSKISAKDKEEIRIRLQKGDSQSAIARDYNVSRKTIYLINKNIK